jgi:hypothetical protein
VLGVIRWVGTEVGSCPASLAGPAVVRCCWSKKCLTCVLHRAAADGAQSDVSGGRVRGHVLGRWRAKKRGRACYFSAGGPLQQSQNVSLLEIDGGHDRRPRHGDESGRRKVEGGEGETWAGGGRRGEGDGGWVGLGRVGLSRVRSDQI